jgi:Mg-chelatase subunit ChlD
MAQMASQTARAAAPAQAGQRATASVATSSAEPGAKTALGPAVAATFFGVPSLAQRFAFVLDMSGSMSGQRWSACVKQLAKALEGLTEGSEIFVVLFSDHLATPTREAVWVSASPEWKQTVLDWVSRVSPNGGTEPQPAFDLLFSLPARPDVIYFLTDGQFSSPSPSRLQKQCHGIGTGVLSTLGNLIIKKDESSGPPPTIINTITLDDPSGASMCKEIAKKSGGQYVHVSSSDSA